MRLKATQIALREAPRKKVGGNIASATAFLSLNSAAQTAALRAMSSCARSIFPDRGGSQETECAYAGRFGTALVARQSSEENHACTIQRVRRVQNPARWALKLMQEFEVLRTTC